MAEYNVIKRIADQAGKKDFNNLAIANDYRTKIFGIARGEGKQAKAENLTSEEGKQALKDEADKIRKNEAFTVKDAYGEVDTLFTELNLGMVYDPVVDFIAALDEENFEAQAGAYLNRMDQRVGQGAKSLAVQTRIGSYIRNNPQGVVTEYLGEGKNFSDDAIRSEEAQNALIQTIFDPSEENKSQLERVLEGAQKSVQREAKKYKDLTTFTDEEEKEDKE